MTPYLHAQPIIALLLFTFVINLSFRSFCENYIIIMEEEEGRAQMSENVFAYIKAGQR